MDDSMSNSDIIADTSVDRIVRARYSLDLKSNPPTLGRPTSETAAPSSALKQTTKHTRRISLADAKRTHHEEMPLVMVREMAKGHSGAYQWRRGAIFISYPPVEQKQLDGMQTLINQKCWCHSKEPWLILELFKTSTYAAGPQSYGDITILLGTLATYCPEQLYLFSDPEDSRVLDRHKQQHDFKLPSSPFILPLKCLYLVHQRNVLAKLLPWFRVPLDTMAIYMDVLESAQILSDEDRHAELLAIHEWISDLIHRCKASGGFKEVQRAEVKVKPRRRRCEDASFKQHTSPDGGSQDSSYTRYAVKTRVLHQDGRGSSWSFALETPHPEHGVAFVVELVSIIRSLGPAKEVVIPKRQWNAIDSPMLVALSSLSH